MADEEEEEVFGFSGNVFVESIDVKERKRLNEERKAAARKVTTFPAVLVSLILPLLQSCSDPLYHSLSLYNHIRVHALPLSSGQSDRLPIMSD